MADVDNTAGGKLVANVALTLMARFSMLVAAASLPIAGWMIQRGISSIDEVSHKLDQNTMQNVEINGNVKLIQQTQTLQTQIIADHETRVRTLESINRNLRDRDISRPN